MKIYVITPFILQVAIWPLCRSLFYWFTHLKMAGLDNLQGLSRKVIFASNHLSELDAILIPASLPFLGRFTPMFYISRPKPFYTNSGWRKLIYGGLLFKSLGAYPAIAGKRDYELTLKDHIKILRDQNSMTVFPEGQRNFDGVARRVHGGVACLAYCADVPIVPVRIEGSHMSGKDFLTRKKRIKITFGKPIYPGELFVREPVVDENRNDFKEAAIRVVEAINNLH